MIATNSSTKYACPIRNVRAMYSAPVITHFNILRCYSATSSAIKCNHVQSSAIKYNQVQSSAIMPTRTSIKYACPYTMCAPVSHMQCVYVCVCVCVCARARGRAPVSHMQCARAMYSASVIEH